jgi:hypothetical protein
MVYIEVNHVLRAIFITLTGDVAEQIPQNPCSPGRPVIWPSNQCDPAISPGYRRSPRPAKDYQSGPGHGAHA